MFNLTYDESSHDDSITLIRLHSAPTITPEGFKLNGYDTRLSTTQVPAYVNSDGDFGLQATIGFTGNRLKTSGKSEPILFIGNTLSGVDNIKYALSVKQDPKIADISYLALEYGNNSSIPLGRSQWRFEGQFPKLNSYVNKPLPQALFFIDKNTLVVTGHYKDLESRAFKINLITNEIIGEFTFGLLENKHISGMKKDSAGNVWVCDYLDKNLSIIDLDQSFATGQAVITLNCDLKAMQDFASINFLTVNNTEYLMAAEYGSKSSKLYLLDKTKLVNGYVFSPNNSYKAFVVGWTVQGIEVKNNTLYLTRNAKNTDSKNIGYIERYDNISSKFTTLSTGAELTPNQTLNAPSPYPEDCMFRPETNEFWTMSEGNFELGQPDLMLSIWSSKLDGKPVENTYTINRTGNNHDVLINNNFAVSFTPTENTVANVISIGGYSSTDPSMKNGFSIGKIKNVALTDKIITSSEYASYSLGVHESNSLTAFKIPMTDETSAWTNVVGAITERSELPPPYEGSFYYMGGRNLQTISKQQFEVSALIGSKSLNSAYILAEWQQASYNDLDPCSIGVAAIGGSQNKLLEQYGAIVSMPNGDAGLNPNWNLRNISMPLPDNTKYVEVMYRSDRTDGSEGSNNDGYIDSVTATIYIK